MEVLEATLKIINEYLPKDHFLVDLTFEPVQGRDRLSIILDGDHGVSIEVCALISRKVGYFLEQDEVIEAEYNLQVSSPGADAPFTDIRQYHKNIGREVKIVLKDGTTKEGILEEVEEEKSILFREKLKAADKGRKAKFAKEEKKIEISELNKINVILTF